MPAERMDRAPWGLLAPLFLALVAVAAATVILVVEVSGLNQRHRMEEIRASRGLHTAQNLKVPLEAAISLGLPLEQLPRVQEMLEREQAAEPATLSIEVIDPHGRVLFGTDRSFLGDLVHESWLAKAEAAKGGSWRSAEGVVGVALVNGFGATIGHIAVRYARTTEAEAPSFDRAATLAALTGLGVFALGLAIMFARVYAPLGRNLAMATDVLIKRRTGIPPDVPSLAALAAEAMAAMQASRTAMDAVLAEARRIDENA